jgi:hypothetical protein
MRVYVCIYVKYIYEIICARDMSFFEGLVKEEFYLVFLWYENNTSAIFFASLLFSLLLLSVSDFTKKGLETKEEGSIPPRTPLVIIIIRRKYMRVVGTRRGYDESIIIVLITIMVFSFFLFERTRGPGGDNFRHHSLSVGFRKTFLQDTRRAFD